MCSFGFPWIFILDSMTNIDSYNFQYYYYSTISILCIIYYNDLNECYSYIWNITSSFVISNERMKHNDFCSDSIT